MISPRPRPPLTPEARLQLRMELEAPYRNVRRFIFGAVAISGGLGAMVFLIRVSAGRELETALPSLALQLGVLAGAMALLRWENRSARKLKERLRRTEEILRSGPE